MIGTSNSSTVTGLSAGTVYIVCLKCVVERVGEDDVFTNKTDVTVRTGNKNCVGIIYHINKLFELTEENFRAYKQP